MGNMNNLIQHYFFFSILGAPILFLSTIDATLTGRLPCIGDKFLYASKKRAVISLG